MQNQLIHTYISKYGTVIAVKDVVKEFRHTVGYIRVVCALSGLIYSDSFTYMKKQKLNMPVQFVTVVRIKLVSALEGIHNKNNIEVAKTYKSPNMINSDSP